MTGEEFNVQETELLKQIPPEFRSALSGMAYEDGHYAGYEEVLSILRGLINSLEEPIANFEKRIRSE